ncbi:hypothetical protein ACLPHM_01630 [Paenalcaligenes sp. Me131]|uniref:hypothetical protein n=1 Tax=Paenalcaligenes sp. Me131 TaxID=3392636 RepID=UPI003D2D1534
MRALVVGVLCAVALAGCGQLQNVTVEQIRTPDHLRKSGTIEKSISQIQQSLYDYGDKCRSPRGQITVNPSDHRKARVTSYMDGLTKDSAALLIELNQVGDTLTEYQGYTYYSNWTKILEQILYIMEGGLDCDK